MRNENQIADVLRIERDLEVERVFDGAHRRERVHGGADAAEALGEEPGLARVAAEEDALDAAESLDGLSTCSRGLERATGFEPATKSLGSSYSTN